MNLFKIDSRIVKTVFTVSTLYVEKQIPFLYFDKFSPHKSRSVINLFFSFSFLSLEKKFEKIAKNENPKWIQNEKSSVE